MLLLIGITACQTAFKPTFCDIVNSNKLSCHPTDTSREKFDLRTIDALGYRCLSSDDWRDGKKRLRRAIEFDSNFMSLVEPD